MQEADFAYIQRLVMESSGIVLEAGKEYLVELRLTPIVRQKGLGTLHDLIEALRQGSSQNVLRTDVMEAMTTNETTFFRDVHPFEVLRTLVIPSLIRNRANDHQLSIWCAASSTGQEPYSVAMLIREHFPELASWRIHFTASDISKGVLARAAEGLYSTLEINRGLPPAYLQKYFDKCDKGWQVKAEIRRMVTFQSINLIQDWPLMIPQDVIFVRNVMIYFDIPSKQKILTRMATLLRPDGFMFLGGAETTLNLCDAFDRVPVSLTSCYRPKSASVIAA